VEEVFHERLIIYNFWTPETRVTSETVSPSGCVVMYCSDWQNTVTYLEEIMHNWIWVNFFSSLLLLFGLNFKLILGYMRKLFSDEPRMRSGSWDDTGSVVGNIVGNSGSGVSHHRLDQSQRPVSCEESWYSGGSDQELSSGDESEKSGHLIAKWVGGSL
jgi:hypothetical protein